MVVRSHRCPAKVAQTSSSASAASDKSPKHRAGTATSSADQSKAVASAVAAARAGGVEARGFRDSADDNSGDVSDSELGTGASPGGAAEEKHQPVFRMNLQDRPRISLSFTSDIVENDVGICVSLLLR